VRRLPRLAETERKLHAIAEALGAGRESVHLREAATETRVKGMELSRYRMLTFSTHGLMAGEFRDVSEPALSATRVPITRLVLGRLGTRPGSGAATADVAAAVQESTGPATEPMYDPPPGSHTARFRLSSNREGAWVYLFGIPQCTPDPHGTILGHIDDAGQEIDRDVAAQREVRLNFVHARLDPWKSCGDTPSPRGWSPVATTTGSSWWTTTVSVAPSSTCSTCATRVLPSGSRSLWPGAAISACLVARAVVPPLPV